MPVYQYRGIPLNISDNDSEYKGYFEGAAEHRLLVKKCLDCGLLRGEPGPGCPWCTSLRWEWHEVSGKGRHLQLSDRGPHGRAQLQGLGALCHCPGRVGRAERGARPQRWPADHRQPGGCQHGTGKRGKRRYRQASGSSVLRRRRRVLLTPIPPKSTNRPRAPSGSTRFRRRHFAQA